MHVYCTTYNVYIFSLNEVEIAHSETLKRLRNQTEMKTKGITQKQNLQHTKEQEG